MSQSPGAAGSTLRSLPGSALGCVEPRCRRGGVIFPQASDPPTSGSVQSSFMPLPPPLKASSPVAAVVRVVTAAGVSGQNQRPQLESEHRVRTGARSRESEPRVRTRLLELVRGGRARQKQRDAPAATANALSSHEIAAAAAPGLIHRTASVLQPISWGGPSGGLDDAAQLCPSEAQADQAAGPCS